jgi:WD40 repeat protein
VAAGAGYLFPKDALVRVWDLGTGEVQVLDAGDGAFICWLKFASESELLVATEKTLRRWDLLGAAPRIVGEVDVSHHERGDEVVIRDFSPDGRKLLLSAGERLWIEDVGTHAIRDLIWNGREDSWVSFDPTGELVVSGDGQGAVRVGSARGGEPHLLLGHEDAVQFVSVSPDGQAVAAGGVDGSIRIWPMPDLSKPPLHTLPRADLLAKLKSLTNLRAVRDPESETGWRIDVGPFPGWETVPTW